jgi:hypothetical protein
MGGFEVEIRKKDVVLKRKWHMDRQPLTKCENLFINANTCVFSLYP